MGDGSRLAQEAQRVPLLHGADALDLRARQEEPVAQLREADEHDGQTQARDMLVGAERDRQEAHGCPRQQAHDDGCREADQWVPGGEGGREAGERAGVHGAFDAKVQHPRAFRDGLADRSVDQRRGVPERGRQQVEEEGHSGASSTCCSSTASGSDSSAGGSSWRTRQRRRASNATTASNSVPWTTAPICEGMPRERSAELAPTLQIAQEERREQDAGHGQPAQHGHHDAGVAVARGEAGGQAELDACDLAHACDPGDGAAHEGHAQEQAFDADTREACRVRREAHGSEAQAGGGPTDDVPGHDEEYEGDDEAQVKPGTFEELGQVGAFRDGW